MKANGYYNEKVINKFMDAFDAAKEEVKAGADLKVRISAANSKMGNVASVSTLPFLTCPGCAGSTCGKKCYAAKLANLRPSVLKSYAINTAIARERPDLYWKQVDAAAAAVRFFRFHVSGDIIDSKYFENMVQVVRNNSKTEFLCFTKRFKVVNRWIAAGNTIPENLHLLFSGWENLVPENPYKLPETDVVPKDFSGAWWDMEDGWQMCGGNCFECAITGAGCWTAKAGETILFRIH